MIKKVDEMKDIIDVLSYYSDTLRSLQSGDSIIENMANKFYMYSTVLELIEKKKRIGFCVFYHNDRIFGKAFLSMIAVKPLYVGKGYARQLLSEVEKICAEDQMKEIGLEVRKDNHRAIRFYYKNGYKVDKSISDNSMLMHKALI